MAEIRCTCGPFQTAVAAALTIFKEVCFTALEHMPSSQDMKMGLDLEERGIDPEETVRPPRPRESFSSMTVPSPKVEDNLMLAVGDLEGLTDTPDVVMLNLVRSCQGGSMCVTTG